MSVELQFTIEQVGDAKARAFANIQRYCDKKGYDTHIMRNMQQIVLSAAEPITTAIKVAGKPPHIIAKARLRVPLSPTGAVDFLAAYMEKESNNSRFNELMKAEYRYCVELFAQELGVRDQVLEAVTARKRGSMQI